jgi:hypothetical protein
LGDVAEGYQRIKNQLKGNNCGQRLLMNTHRELRQRGKQIAASYEDYNDAEFLRIDLALELAFGKDQLQEILSYHPSHKKGASEKRLVWGSITIKWSTPTNFGKIN